jgi:hypothetical protein
MMSPVVNELPVLISDWPFVATSRCQNRQNPLKIMASGLFLSWHALR